LIGYRQSAEQNHPRGQGILGFCYGEGFGVERDEQLALHHYMLAAKQGESVAIYNVGYCWEEGNRHDDL
jgi:TPR repeat protein